MPATEVSIRYDKSCFLCAGNERISGDVNPNYTGTFVFKNDFAALTDDTPEKDSTDDPLFKLQSAKGESRVICFSPDHSRTLAELSHTEIEQVIATWIKETNSLSKRYPWVQIFENKGETMGCSQPHPHGQIWANSFIPTMVSKKTITKESILKNMVHRYCMTMFSVNCCAENGLSWRQNTGPWWCLIGQAGLSKHLFCQKRK